MNLEETIATYDRIAEHYAHQWQDRDMMSRAVAAFTELLPSGALVLDVGCGPGFDCQTLASNGLRVVGLDLSWGMLQSGRSRGYAELLVQADMRFLPVRRGMAGVWCNAALLHLARKDAQRTLREFFRVLEDDGILFVAVKEGEGEDQRSETYGADAPRYYTYWQPNQLDAALRQSGFNIVTSWTGEAPEYRWLCRLLKRRRE